MTLIDLLEDTIENVLEEAAQQRVKQGLNFQGAFFKTYDVEEMTKGNKHMGVEIKAINVSSNSTPEYFSTNSMFNASLQGVNVLLDELTFFKGDFQNQDKNLKYKGKEKERVINGGTEGNYFECKKTKYNYKLTNSVLYSELKKFASRNDFIKLFADENDIKRYENEKDRKRKSRLFTQISNKIINNKNSDFYDSIRKFNNNINRLNGIITNLLSNQNVKSKIKANLKKKLGNKDWFFVTGTGANDHFVFHKVDPEKFIDHIFTKIRKWKKISRITFYIKIGEVSETELKESYDISLVEKTSTLLDIANVNIPTDIAGEDFTVRMSFKGEFQTEVELTMKDIPKISKKVTTNEEAELYKFLKEIKCL